MKEMKTNVLLFDYKLPKDTRGKNWFNFKNVIM